MADRSPARDFWDNRRAYLDNPSYRHPVHGTPLQERYVPVKQKVTVSGPDGLTILEPGKEPVTIPHK